jgi:flagellar protein FliL
MSRKQAAPEPHDDAAPEPKKSKKKLVTILLVVLLAGGASAAFLLKGGSPAAAEAPKPGAVLRLDSISLNLADGHYLKVGVALQLVAGVAEPPDGARALDSTIALLSNQQMDTLLVAKNREQVKAELLKAVEKDYPGEVMDIYFTDFAMQ